MTRFKIETPVRGVTTDIGPAHFQQGVAEVDDTTVGVPGVLAYCRHNGYTVTDLDAAAVEQDLADGVGDDDGNPVTPPPGNATTEAWRDHVLAIGKDRVTADQVTGLNRDQLKELAGQLAQEGPSA
jgi:hypothetical protein